MTVRLLTMRERGREVTDSALEARVLQVLRKAGLPEPEQLFLVTTDDEFIAEVDFAYPKQRLAIQADGYRYHSSRKAWSDDRDRLSNLAANGWRVIHATWKDVTTGEADFVARVRRALRGSVRG